jgi:hypothetical protein
VAERIPVPLLLSRSATMWLSAAAGAVSVPAVLIWAFLTQPVGGQIAALVFGAVFVAFVAYLVTRRTWLDPHRGLLVREVAGVWRRSVAWADASELRVRSNGAGQALLQVRGAGRRTSTHLALVAVDMGGDRSLSPDFLRTLADQIERWAPQRGAVVRQLRAQADHVAGGGTVRESPVARAHLGRVL